MAFTIEKLHEEFGARILDADFPEIIAGDALDDLRAAIDRYSFVLFPEQEMDDERQMALTRALGDPEPSHVAKGEGKLEYFGTIGNVQEDGTALGNDHRKTVFLTGNNMWHSDASFKPVPAFASIMCAYETPDEGGETLFASGRSAWARQPDDRRRALAPMIAIHDYVYSRSKVAPDAVSDGLRATLPPVRQKLVRTNPATGEKNLFLGSHVREIEGMAPAEGRALVDELTDEAVRPAHVYAHKWRPGDLVIWDNRCLIHRGAGYDADKYRRYMRQTRVSGTASSLEE